MKPYRLGCMRTSLLLLVVVVLAACSPAVTLSPSPAPSSAPPASPSPSPAASASASAAASPSVAPSVSFAACDLPTWHKTLPSGRLVKVEAATAAGLDTLTFQFAAGGDNPGTPTGDITIAKPPFTEGSSGQAMTVEGDQVLQVRFDKMDIVDAAGKVIYAGEGDLKPGFPALREAVMFDESEGVVGWYVGLSGPTCVSIASDPTGLAVTLRIAHP
jgi:hypothetical protein